ncbi:MurR/RpiR family transcriptional regulator [Aminivibrio sp.]|uniref:MurR/RpiR family transcriptional regulator n=1 Tax=Aminivibrio sp. TaxID=1872489 RepID=UPI001A372A80|nr:MurR/RpiR family transcriptional regulator [Aminivibrio sp.]MBL3540746.1 MurR/RpiR family transcriptional regulator [Aminivibrio sp.]
MEDFREKIRAYFRKNTISKAKRTVANFFVSSPEEAAFLNLGELAERIGVSPATISRTSVEMGFNGYPDLQEQIRSKLKIGITPVERLKETPVDENTPIWTSSILRDQESLNTLLSLNSGEKFQKAVELFASAPNVYSLALRSSYPLTFFFNLLLFQIRPNVHHISIDDGQLTESVFDIGGNDVLFVVSLPRYTMFVLEVTEKIRRTGCRVISITDSELSPLAIASDIAFFCRYESVSFFNSNIAAEAIINALLAGVLQHLGQDGVKRLEKHSNAMKEWSSRFSLGEQGYLYGQ